MEHHLTDGAFDGLVDVSIEAPEGISSTTEIKVNGKAVRNVHRVRYTVDHETGVGVVEIHANMVPARFAERCEVHLITPDDKLPEGHRDGFWHNVVAHPLLVLWPRFGRWLHERTEPTVPTRRGS